VEQSRAEPGARTWSMEHLPGKSGLRVANSAKVQAAAHTSCALSYCPSVSITSGARYQRVTTYGVMGTSPGELRAGR